MNRALIRCVPLIALTILAGACATTTMSRINANRAAFESWPVDMREAILNGQVVKGMTPDMVRVAKGNPTRIEHRDGQKGPEEVWVYQKGGALGGNTELTIGGGYGGVGVGAGVPVSGVDEVQEVVFVDGTVLIAY